MSNPSRIAILLIMVLAIAAAFAEDIVPVSVTSNNLMNEDVVLVEFDGGVITRKDLDERISKIPPNQQGRYRTIEGQIQVMDVMAVEEALMIKALKMNIDADPEVVQKIQDGVRQFYIQEYYKRRVVDMVSLTDEDKRNYFMANPDLFIVLPIVNISYMQVEDEASGLLALAQIEAGKSWEDVSNQFNLNSYIKGLKGVIKNIRLNGNIPGIGNDAEMEDLIRENTGNLEKIIGPVKTLTGWHIFKVTQYVHGRAKTYDEVVPEIEQRLRPLREREVLDGIKAELMAKYEVVTDSVLIARMDLNVPSKNQDIMDEELVSANQQELVFTVKSVMDAFSRLSPQEQIFYVKGEGARQLIDQELIRSLMHVDARELGYNKYFEQKEEYQQMVRFYLLNTAFRKLVLESIVVSDEEVRAYYDSHLSEYMSPGSRSIQVLWFKDEASAQRTWKKFSRIYLLDDEARIQQIIEQESANPALSILDNQYDNGIITGIGPDAEFSRKIWDNPIGYLSPVFTTARGDIVFFRNLSENMPAPRSFTETEPKIFAMLKKEKETSRQQEVIDELNTEFNVKKYPERLRLLLSAEELFNMADDSARLRNFKDAINSYDQIIQNYQNGVDDYKASFMKAFLIAEEIRNTDLALDLFKAFLHKYPTGDLNESAQFMIDSLEGNIELDIEDEEIPDFIELEIE